MEKADIKKKIHLALVALIFYIQKGTAFSTSPSALTSCASSTANISFTLIFDAGESIIGKRIWRFSGGKIAESDGTTLTPEPSYSSRLIAYGTSGISLSNITDADAGAYTYVILISPAIRAYTATTSLSVQVAPPAPPSGCQVSATQSSNILTCAVNTNSGYCGTPSLNAFWVYSTNTSNQIICNVTETYQCCATSAALTCYNGSSNDFCKLFNCTDVTNKTSTTTTTTTDTTSTTTTTTDTTSTTTTATDTTSTTTTTTDTTSTTTTTTDTTSTATTELPPNDTNNTSTSKSPTTVLPSNNTDIKVIVPAVVVPCGLLIIVALVLIVVFCVRRKAGKNVRESPDGMAIQDKGNNIDEWKQSLGHGKATDNIDTVYTTPDGFIIYPGPAAISTARSYKDKKYHGVTDQYSRPNPGKHHHQADYIPSTFTSARAYTHRGKNHHVVTDQYSRPYPGNYGNQSVYFPSTYKSARTYAQKGKTYEGHQPASNPMANSRLAYDQPAYYPQTGYYGQSGQDVYYSGGGQHSYGQRSRSHHDNNGRKQHIDYYSQYEMADYGGNRAGYRHTKQNTAFYY